MALSAEAGTKHGLSPSVWIFDELAQAKTRDLFDALDTAQGARREPAGRARLTHVQRRARGHGADGDASSRCRHRGRIEAHGRAHRAGQEAAHPVTSIRQVHGIDASRSTPKDGG
jgi:hypothetical protein